MVLNRKHSKPFKSILKTKKHLNEVDLKSIETEKIEKSKDLIDK